MTLLWVALVFVVLVVLSMPIVFALGLAGLFGLWHGGYPMQQIASALVSGSQSWVLLAIPAFVFAGGLMERCGMSHALVEFAGLHADPFFNPFNTDIINCNNSGCSPVAHPE